MTDKIMQIGNIVPSRKVFDNPQEGRVYSIDGIARAIKSTGGSGNVPKVIVYEYE